MNRQQISESFIGSNISVFSFSCYQPTWQTRELHCDKFTHPLTLQACCQGPRLPAPTHTQCTEAAGNTLLVHFKGRDESVPSHPLLPVSSSHINMASTWTPGPDWPPAHGAVQPPRSTCYHGSFPSFLPKVFLWPRQALFKGDICIPFPLPPGSQTRKCLMKPEHKHTKWLPHRAGLFGSRGALLFHLAKASRSRGPKGQVELLSRNHILRVKSHPHLGMSRPAPAAAVGRPGRGGPVFSCRPWTSILNKWLLFFFIEV